MKKYAWYAVVAVIVVVAAVLFLTSKKTNAPVSNEANGDKPAVTTSDKQSSPSATSSTSTWEGVLKVSNNPAKGNLMLETQNRTIYLKTNRDFSSLLGKTVLVGYEGTLDSFALGDIVEKPTTPPPAEQ